MILKWFCNIYFQGCLIKQREFSLLSAHINNARGHLLLAAELPVVEVLLLELAGDGVGRVDPHDVQEVVHVLPGKVVRVVVVPLGHQPCAVDH